MNVNTKSQFKNNQNFKKLLILFNNRNYMLIITIIIIITMLFSIFFWYKSPNYGILYSNLSIEDKNEVIKKLEEMHVSYHLEKQSGTILVPNDKIYILRINLLKNGFPKSPYVGYELLDQERFGISQFNEQINYQRALEGELEKTIQQLNNIKHVTVHLSLPKSSLFLYEKKEPSAAISLIIDDNKKIEYEEIRAIVHLVSSSVSGLLLSKITIIDQYGHLLNQSGQGYNELNNACLNYTNTIEEKYSRKIEEILIPLFGVENIHAKVTVQVDFDSKDRMEEKYSPNYLNQGQSVRSRHVVSSTKNIKKKFLNKDNYHKNYNDTSSHILKNKNNLKNKIFVNNNYNYDKYHYIHPIKKPFDNDSKINSDYEDTVNYELNHTILHNKVNKGTIKRISAAVIINYLKLSNNRLVPLTPYKITKIKKLIKEVIGYSEQRGDSLEVVNSLFFLTNTTIKCNINKNLNNTLTNKISNNIHYVILTSIIILIIIIFKKQIARFISQKHNIKKNNNIKKDQLLNQNLINKNIFNNNDFYDKKYFTQEIQELRNSDTHIITKIIRHWINEKL
ncbi:flagellar M-ring protein [Buchnera aphidicola (Nipponaphis monzeni)]|uniref:Flagellar M-ring protein n=1 Tax=Buchnera aphidicola (Nipponaphis monzeni) TaxID=2495405 RepID=A0A455T9R8_9GAMM|nr:flagellar basal-body MS-ring/collar protein FliF [Buchnera aphidicola]BBI01074.1 flagellar M-ring protein [Buchnera aphidicola (Nipponaphis monzeni)]